MDTSDKGRRKVGGKYSDLYCMRTRFIIFRLSTLRGFGKVIFDVED